MNRSEQVSLEGWGSTVRKRRQKGKTGMTGETSGEPVKHIYTSKWILKAVQWLRIYLPVCETWVRFLVGGLRSHMPRPQNKLQLLNLLAKSEHHSEDAVQHPPKKNELKIICYQREGRIFPCNTVDKNPPANAGDTGLIPGPGRSHKLQNS